MNKLCKDCKHSREYTYVPSKLARWLCVRPNLIDGEPGDFQGVAPSCFNEREVVDNYHRCGPEGKYWEAKSEVL